MVLWDITRFSSIVLLTIAFVTLFAAHHWFADLLANLRVQQCLALAILLGLCIVFRRWVWAIAMLVCVLNHTAWLCGENSNAVDRETTADTLTITLANVLTQNDRHDEIVADLHSGDPDVFAILELSSPLSYRLRNDFGTSHPYSITRPQDAGNFGIGLYSRFPIEDAATFTLNSSIESITATIKTPTGARRIFVTHTFPPIGARGFARRNDHLMQLANMIRKSKRQTPELPIILVGDLNVTPWSPHFNEFQSLSELRRTSGRWDVTPTWYRFPLFPFGLVLDHVMTSGELAYVERKVGPEIGSDHRSVTVTVADR
ncbi:Endonuclease/Exonuclease/phosphatase family protein [Planctomycetes bacterium CA13]|uniref:Endonuclease/Exonuclease/phosphatase family protein n=1 Tax=Novipirellula herctigrandis TaxID=2527986 RepID=A0A5C5ZDS6_9BACT|nr:Endonuclease/Exonuclease/phosphatase family protein [Planctomycetes bacterium CA13]